MMLPRHDVLRSPRALALDAQGGPAVGEREGIGGRRAWSRSVDHRVDHAGEWLITGNDLCQPSGRTGDDHHAITAVVLGRHSRS